MSRTLKQELAEVLNRHSVENASDTPDFILAGFLMDCLRAWEVAVHERDGWGKVPVANPTVDDAARTENVETP